MPFPESNRVIYQKNPLSEVICQIRFPTILEIGFQDPSEFQRKIRSGYPLYERADATPPISKEVSGLLAGLPVHRSGEYITHNFLTENSNRFISLNRDFLAITEKRYQRWEDFRKEIKTAQVTLEEIYQPSFYSRIGLRYQDVIYKDRLGLESESWNSLVNPSFIGVLGASEVRDHIEDIRTQAVIRIGEVQGGFVTLRHGLIRRSQNGEEVYMIDADFFTEDRGATKDVFDVLDRFNRLAGNFFRWAITPRLREALEPVEVQ